jgi:hypothetical protein
MSLEVDEVHEIMMLLRGGNATTDGDYRNIHLGTILEYLRNQKTETKQVTLQKLSLMIGMAQRQIRENYLDGLIAFGVIALNPDCKSWTWIGIKAIKGKNGQLRTNNPIDNEYVVGQFTEYANKENERKLKEGKEKKENE